MKKITDSMDEFESRLPPSELPKTDSANNV